MSEPRLHDLEARARWHLELEERPLDQPCHADVLLILANEAPPPAP